MDGFLRDTDERTLSEWTKYLERRKKGHGPELFTTAEEAKAWLVQQAPTKFVDGAWLGHMHKITTPFALRGVTKQVFQILSEELGDGDLDKHHVNLYRKLLHSIGCPLPNGHSVEFIHASELEQNGSRGIWAAAVGQLAISLFPDEFLPEILGFNMHFETVSLETMQVAHEIKSFGIDPYYFLIHITIDNADSGHTAMAAHAVRRYLDVVGQTESKEAVQQAWKRVQVGYIMSQTLENESRVINCEQKGSREQLDTLSIQVMDLFRSKALVSHSMHSQSRARIGSYGLHEWLDEIARSCLNDLHMLTTLSQARPWIYAGASSKSLLVREMSWGGRMFGAFTESEVTTICRWIDSLQPVFDPFLYWKFTQRQPVPCQRAAALLRDPTFHQPFLPNDTESHLGHTLDSHEAVEMVQKLDYGCAAELDKKLAAQTASLARLPDIIALWFAHLGLLENTINTPSRTTSPVYSRILRVLRAQSGFCVEGDIVAGMDEARRHSCTSLVDIGLELTEKLPGTTAASARPQTLQHVFLLVASHGQGEESLRLANNMLRWRARPIANLGFLLGVALASVDMKRAVWRAPDLLSQKSRRNLESILERESIHLIECARELQASDDALYRELLRGKYVAQSIISKCI
ncbi:hypothetical protein V2A60_007181 [Cordyceps javanica]